MANITETDSFDAGVYQLETTDPALAGANGIMNTPPRSLANRTRFLLNRILDGILSFVADSGVKNAIVAAFPQAIEELVDGMEVSFRVAVTSDAGVTLQLTNAGGATLPTLPLWGGDHVALAGGELPAGATVLAKLNLTLNASNGGAWVIISITGGYARILTAASGDMSNRAANMAAVFNATDGMATVNVGVGADVVLTAAQCGCAILKLTGTPAAAINLLLPTGQTGQWVINNQQGGTNNLTVKPSGGAGVILPQGSSPTIVVSDGTTASFASAQAEQAAFSIFPFTGITGTTLTIPGGYTPGAIFIEKNGPLLEPGDFNATISPTITLVKAAVSTDVFNVYRFTSFTVANALQKSGDTMGGALIVQPATGPTNPAQLQQVGHGQCILNFGSATLVQLTPKNGNNLIINGVPQQIPLSGITGSNSGLIASTFYLVYAFMSAGVMALEISSTAHVTSAEGIEIKSGDPTRTLVGGVATNASAQFSETNNFFSVISWFNRRDFAAQPVNAIATIVTNVAQELNAASRITFPTWSDECVSVSAQCYVSNNTNQAAEVFGIGVDSTTTYSGLPMNGNIPFSGAAVGLSAQVRPTLSEGIHFVTTMGQSGTGTSNFNQSISIVIRG